MVSSDQHHDRVNYESDEPSTSGHTEVYVRTENRRTELPLRTDLVNHSPTGFSWGYGGSGTSQLALAMTEHALGDERALDNYVDVKEEFLVDSSEPISIAKSDIVEFVEG